MLCLLAACPRLLASSVVVAALAVALFPASLALAGQPAEATAATQPLGRLRTLTTARQVHDLTPEEAARHYPVHLRAVCIVCFTGWHGFFANDGATDIYVEIMNQAPLTPEVHPGALLDIVGVTGSGEYAPVVDRSVLRVLGEGPIPSPRLIGVDQLLTGIEDGQWIAFEGTVRSARLRDSMLSLVIASGQSQVEVMTTPAGEKEIRRFVHARVRVQRTAGPVFNQRRQLIAVNVYSPSWQSLRILEPAPIDPFALPVKQVKNVFEYVPGSGPDRLVRIRGVVTARWGQTVFIHDGIQGAPVLGADIVTLNPGDLVDAVGYPVLGDTAHTMEDAIFRKTGTAPLPEPKPITLDQAISGDFEGDPVRLDGRLLEEQKAPDQTTLLVSAGDAVFAAVLPAESKQRSLAGLQSGSRIRLTGICVISETRPSRHFRLPKAFQILLRSPADVVVLETPSWRTLAHALLLLAIVLAGMLMVLIWVVALRRQVAQQTGLLRQSEERFRHLALHDPLTGLATRLLLTDRLNIAVEMANRHELCMALLMLDIDRFKQINDSYGHAAGDRVLQVTTNRLSNAVRKSDTVARMGGDEFVVLLSDLRDSQAAEQIAAALVETLAVPIAIDGKDILVSVSIGVCALQAGEVNADELLKNADAALYQAKAKGRGCFQVSPLHNTRMPKKQKAKPCRKPSENS